MTDIVGHTRGESERAERDPATCMRDARRERRGEPRDCARCQRAWHRCAVRGGPRSRVRLRLALCLCIVVCASGYPQEAGSGVLLRCRWSREKNFDSEKIYYFYYIKIFFIYFIYFRKRILRKCAGSWHLFACHYCSHILSVGIYNMCKLNFSFEGNADGVCVYKEKVE